MSRIANSLMSQDVVQRMVASPRTVFIAILGLLIMIVAIMFTKEFFVILSGLAGTAAGYWLHNFQKDENPIYALRSVCRMRRVNAVLLGSVISALIAILLFWEGIATSEELAVLGAFYTAGAYAFFAFSVSSYVFGRQAISRARRRLGKASVEQAHIWHMRAEASRRGATKGDAY